MLVTGTPNVGSHGTWHNGREGWVAKCRSDGKGSCGFGLAHETQALDAAASESHRAHQAPSHHSIRAGQVSRPVVDLVWLGRTEAWDRMRDEIAAIGAPSEWRVVSEPRRSALWLAELPRG